MISRATPYLLSWAVVSGFIKSNAIYLPLKKNEPLINKIEKPNDSNLRKSHFSLLELMFEITYVLST